MSGGIGAGSVSVVKSPSPCPSINTCVGHSRVTSAVNTLRNPTFWPFVVVQIIVALYAWAAARAGLFRSFRTAVPAGLGLGVIASLTSTPISYLLFGCTTTGGIALTTALGKALGLPPLGAEGIYLITFEVRNGNAILARRTLKAALVR